MKGFSFRWFSRSNAFSFASPWFVRAVANVSARKRTFWHNFSGAQMVVLHLLFITWTSHNSPSLALFVRTPWWVLPLLLLSPSFLQRSSRVFLIIVHKPANLPISKEDVSIHVFQADVRSLPFLNTHTHTLARILGYQPLWC